MYALTRAFLAAVCLALAATTSRGQDIVDYFDPVGKKEETVTGSIESESPVGIKVKPARGPAKELLIPAADIREVRYKCKVPAVDYRKPFGKERQALQPGVKDEQRKKLLSEALQGFQEILPPLQDTPNAQRFILFKIAQVVARQAEDDKAKVDEAIAKLTAFTKDHSAGWEIASALKQLAQLQEGRGDLQAATRAYADLASVEGITPQMKQESEILGARLLVRAAKYGDAEKKLAALSSTLSAGDPAKSAVQVFLAQCQLAQGNLGTVENQLKTALAGASDAAVQAAGHNILGDYYRQKGQLEDAFWEYLRVDVQYGQDREELAKALYHLATLFDKVKNDRVRAQDCLTRLQDKAAFAGTEYYKKATAEKP